MPFRQSILSFGRPAASSTPSDHQQSRSKARPAPSRLDSTASTDMGDTIVVATPSEAAHLPTPSESSNDASSQTNELMSMKEVHKGRGKRVNWRLTKSQSEACLLDTAEEEQNNRTVSGETLVNSNNTSQLSVVQKGISALNLPWSMSEVYNTGSKARLVQTTVEEVGASTDSLATLTPEQQAQEEEDEKQRQEKAAARRAKMGENERLRETKRKVEDDKATRRSSRASMLTKAGDMVSELASTVLGKRKDRVDELKRGDRPRSAIEPFSGLSFEGTDAKKRRLSDSAIPARGSSKSIRRPRDKKWLMSGLYAGQARTFEPNLTESKNKTKHPKKDAEEAVHNAVLPLPMFAGDRLLKHGRDFKLPFDVFSPLPHGQPKPDEWRKDNKNRFVGDAAQEWRTSRFVEHSTCLCRPEVGCDDNCMNRFMYYECDDHNCTLKPEECGNRAFAGLRERAKKGGKYNVGVEVIKTADRGHGVRSNRTFAPNQIIVEYTGEIVNQEECEKRMHTTYKNNECYYLMLFDQNMIIDATTRGSIARFVNHSCQPNCRMEKWTVEGRPRMALFAGDRAIMTGEELTYDYNFDPYSLKNVQECRCGEPGCRGVLGPKEKKQPKNKDETANEGLVKGVKRKVAEVLEDAKERVTKKRKAEPSAVVYDDVQSSPKASPRRTSSKVVKKTIRRTSTPIKATSGVQRSGPKLGRMLSNAKDKASSAKSRAQLAKERASGRRVVSSSSATAVLIEKEVEKENLGVGRSASVRAKAATFRKNVVRTVRGGQGGKTRGMRLLEQQEMEVDGED